MAKIPSKISFKKESFKLISIGRLSYEKGFDLAVDAAKILRDNNIEFQWFIIGEGTMKKELEKKINSIKCTKALFSKDGLKNNISSYISLIGVTDNPYSYIASADILVQTSRSEGKSMVIDEAKILNKPFVITKYPTVYDQASSDISVMVDISAESIATGIMDLYHNRNKIEKMKKNMSNKEYSNEFEIKKYEELFDE